MQIRDRIRELRRVPANQLRPNPKNWRTHPTAQLDALKGVLAEVGFAGASLARELPDGSLMLIDGHARAEISGDAMVPVLVLDVDEDEADKILATFDTLGGMATVDVGQLDELLKSIETDSPAIEAMLADLAKENGLVADLPEPGDGGDDFDATPEDTGPTRAAVGELWLIGGKHRLLVGDCTDAGNVALLMDGTKAEMMHADPPYGVDYDGGHFHSGDVKVKRSREKLVGDDSTDIYGEFLPVALSVVDGPCYVWFAGSKALPVYQAVHDCGGIVSSLLIWHKTNATYAAMNAQYKQRHEPCLYFKPKGSTLRWVGPSDACTIWEFKKEGVNKLHPTQKPIDLVSNAIQNHQANLIYDPFLGSGTTLIAAHRLGRTCYGCEIDPRYADVILKRAEAEGMTCEKID